MSDTAARPGARARRNPAPGTPTHEHISLAETWLASNYHPLPVVIAHAEGAWVTDVDGRRYLDALAGYSALNFGHLHPVLVDLSELLLGGGGIKCCTLELRR